MPESDLAGNRVHIFYDRKGFNSYSPLPQALSAILSCFLDYDGKEAQVDNVLSFIRRT